MKRTHEFAPADRYAYDWGICSYKNDFAQVDSDQDASYFGTWANPVKRAIVNYCEGDVTLTQCDTDAVSSSLSCSRSTAWSVESGYRPIGIEPGYSPEMRAEVRAPWAPWRISEARYGAGRY